MWLFYLFKPLIFTENLSLYQDRKPKSHIICHYTFNLSSLATSLASKILYLEKLSNLHWELWASFVSLCSFQTMSLSSRRSISSLSPNSPNQAVELPLPWPWICQTSRNCEMKYLIFINYWIGSTFLVTAWRDQGNTIKNNDLRWRKTLTAPVIQRLVNFPITAGSAISQEAVDSVACAAL